MQLAFKKETDPKGLLNPGKMIAWENPDFRFPCRQELPFPGPRSADGRVMRVLVLFSHPVESS